MKLLTNLALAAVLGLAFAGLLASLVGEVGASWPL